MVALPSIGDWKRCAGNPALKPPYVAVLQLPMYCVYQKNDLMDINLHGQMCATPKHASYEEISSEHGTPAAANQVVCFIFCISQAEDRSLNLYCVCTNDWMRAYFFTEVYSPTNQGSHSIQGITAAINNKPNQTKPTQPIQSNQPNPSNKIVFLSTSTLTK